MKFDNKNITVSAIAGVLIGGAGILLADHVASPENDQNVPPPPSPAVTAPVRQFSQAFEAVAARVRPAVVSVYSERSVAVNSPDGGLPFGNGNGNPNDLFRQFFGGQTPDSQNQGGQGKSRHHEHKVPERGMGSGMILDTKGTILTNYHVVKEVDKVRVKLADNREFDAEVIGTDPKSDVAIIRIKGKAPANLPTVKLGSSGALKVGDWVLAVGAPFGLTQTVTAGIISATGRNDVGITDYEDFLQTDAAINPGNSGGPLVNMDGEVIGMNTAIATGMGQFAGVGFAIPSDMIQGFVPTLSKGDTITRGFLGVNIQDLNENLAKQFQVKDSNGALVAQVNKDTPAGKAGLKAGDVIVRYDGHAIDNTRELRKLVAATTPDTKVPVVVIRDGRETNIDVTVGKLPAKEVAANGKEGNESAQPSGMGELGVHVQPLTSELAQQFDLENQHGVLINGVEQGSPAEEANLQVGDLIVEANHHAVASVHDLKDALAKDKDSALLLIKRKDASLFVSVKIG